MDCRDCRGQIWPGNAYLLNGLLHARRTKNGNCNAPGGSSRCWSDTVSMKGTASANSFAAPLLLFSEKQRARRTVNATHQVDGLPSDRRGTLSSTLTAAVLQCLGEFEGDRHGVGKHSAEPVTASMAATMDEKRAEDGAALSIYTTEVRANSSTRREVCRA